MNRPMTVKEYAEHMEITPAAAFLCMVVDSEFYVQDETRIVGEPEYDENAQLWSVILQDADGERYAACVDDQLDPGNVFIF